MHSLQKILWSPWAYVVLLMGAVALSFSQASPFPLDDHYNYQRFIETLASGRLDLSIPGFHGSDFLAVPWYWLGGSNIAQIEFLIFWAVLLPLFAFLAGRSLFNSDWEGVVFATIITMMPFLSFVLLRGWTGPAYHSLLLLTIFAAAKRSAWTAPLLGLAILTKPFALALLPLLVVLSFDSAQDVPSSKVKVWWKRHRFVLIGLLIPAVYLLIQYLQVGHIIVGSHTGLTQTNVWQGPVRIFLNLAHSLQILFSVHNYYFPDPALTGPGNMMHTTPLLIFLGLFGLLWPSQYFKDRRIAWALLLGAVIGIGMNALLDHMDHFYMEAGILMLILAALPVLKRQQLWVPLVLATLHFQWFYFYLQFREGFGLDWYFFAVPALVDFLFILWCLIHLRDIKVQLRSTFAA